MEECEKNRTLITVMNLSGEVLKSAPFVWSQRELILAPSTVVIHHQLNNTVRGGEYDKKHRRRERETRDIVKFLSKLRTVPKICCNVQITRITTETNTIIIPNDVFGSSKGCQRKSNMGPLINFLATQTHSSIFYVFGK